MAPRELSHYSKFGKEDEDEGEDEEEEEEEKKKRVLRAGGDAQVAVVACVRPVPPGVRRAGAPTSLWPYRRSYDLARLKPTKDVLDGDAAEKLIYPKVSYEAATK